MSAGKKFESEDLVLFGRRDGNHRVAVISEIYDDDDDDDDDDDSQCSKLQEGFIRVSLYPSAKVKKLKQEQVVLVDRHLNMGELVCRQGDTTKVGCVVECKLMTDLLVLPHMNTVVTNVDVSRLLFVNQYDSSCGSAYLLYDNWAGELKCCTYKYLIKCVPFGFKGWIKSDDMKNVKDMTSIRGENGPYEEGQYYPNQTLTVPYEVLKSVEWVEGLKPPPKMITKFKMHTKRMECIVETFTVDSINVNWKTQVAAEYDGRPNEKLCGEDIKEVQLLDTFSHLSAAVGDRFVGHFEKNDQKNIMPFSMWPKRTAKLYKSMKNEMSKEEVRVNNKQGQKCGASAHQAVDDGDYDSDLTYYTASETSKDFLTECEETRSEVEGILNNNFFPEETAQTEDEMPPPKKPKSEVPPPQKMAATPKKKIAVLDKRKGKKLALYKKKPNNKVGKCSNSVPVGKAYIGEVIMTRTTVTVLWEDGTVEKDIPSRHLAFFEEDLEQCQHQLVPGAFVAMKEDSCGSMCRMVLSVNGKNRIATVAMLDLSDDDAPKMVGTEEVSLLDIKEHPEYHITIGDIVMRIGHRSSDQAVDNIGQVTAELETLRKQIVALLSPEVGQVSVRWANGTTSCEYPSRITAVYSYDDDDQWEDEEQWSTISGAPSISDGSWRDEAITTVTEFKAELKKLNIDELSAVAVSVKSLLTETERSLSACNSKSADICVDVGETQKEGREEGEVSTQTSVTLVSPDPLLDTSHMLFDYRNGSFEVLESVPNTHNMYDETRSGEVIVDRSFMKAIKSEHLILTCSLPSNVHVRAYEDRLDLYSCMMEGVAGTPYYGGLFFFDTKLPDGYPNKPPLIHYKSYCCERLNPNLYEDGTVCLSLLGTWSGQSDSENWNAGSNLLQVFVSINGLVLNSEPYFNEAGYETRRALSESTEKSRRYNETAVVRNLQSMAHIARNPPQPFEHKVNQYYKSDGQKIIDYYENLFGDGPSDPGFPLLPLSQGCILAAKPHLNKLKNIITSDY